MTITQAITYCRRYNARPVYSGICKKCGKIFYQMMIAGRKTGNYCNRQCSMESQKIITYSVNCNFCSNPITKGRFQKRGQDFFFCNITCLSGFIIKFGNHPVLNHAKRIKKGYEYICFKGADHAIHRIIMENIVGRKLTQSESVHHKNHIRLDNRVDNLELMSRSEHSKMHSSLSVKKRVRNKMGQFI